MTKPNSDSGGGTPPGGAPEEAVLELGTGLEQEIVEILSGPEPERARALVSSLHYADVADLLERVSPEERRLIIDVLWDEFGPEVLAELDEAVRDEVIDEIGIESVAAAVQEMESDDAVQIVEELEAHEQQQILDSIPAPDRTIIEAGLAYPEDSAGRLMQRELVTVPAYWTVGQTIDFMRDSADRGDDTLPAVFYDIFVVDPAHKPVGAIPLSRILRTQRPVPVTDIMDRHMNVIPVDLDQEEVAFLFRQRDLVSAPVVDGGGRLVGAITVDDVVDVMNEEFEEDIMRLGGVHEDDLYSAAVKTTRSRFSWLLVNLCTAIIASIVISFFEATLEQIVAVAILMPIVASMGGNAGTQTMTVTVRALATKELSATNALRVVGKEFLVGSFNGVIFAVLTGIVAWVWFDSQALGIVIAAAMVINMVVAAAAGITIPLLLERTGADPAVASGVFLTTVTDVVGFAAFLGLAAWIIL